MTCDDDASEGIDSGDLTKAIRLAAQESHASEREIQAVIAKALRDPATEVRLKALLVNEGISRELQREYLRIFAEWRSSQRKASS